MDIKFLWETTIQLLNVAPVTLGLFFTALVFSAPLSVLVLSLRLHKSQLLNLIAKTYILIFRGTPLIIQLFLIYYGLGQLEWIQQSFLWPILREPFWCAAISISLCSGAYIAEILRGGVLAVPVGQIEAGKAIGMSKLLIVRRIIAPITIKHALPGYSTEVVMIIKSTTLASLVTVMEMTGIAQQIIQRSYRTMEVFVCSAIIYLAITYIIIRICGLLEQRMRNSHAPSEDEIIKPSVNG